VCGRSVLVASLYACVSAVVQTIDHQFAQAQAAGFAIDEVVRGRVADKGVSGAYPASPLGLSNDPNGKRLFDKLVRRLTALAATTRTFAMPSATLCAVAW
jgi:hypothetical protein